MENTGRKEEGPREESAGNENPSPCQRIRAASPSVLTWPKVDDSASAADSLTAIYIRHLPSKPLRAQQSSIIFDCLKMVVLPSTSFSRSIYNTQQVTVSCGNVTRYAYR